MEGKSLLGGVCGEYFSQPHIAGWALSQIDQLKFQCGHAVRLDDSVDSFRA